MFASNAIELENGQTLPGRIGTVTFSIPKELARHQSAMDRLISELATAIDEDRDTVRVANAYEISDECRRQVEAVADAMRALHAAGRNHVWAYYIRNMIRPSVIAEEKADRIIGNPPQGKRKVARDGRIGPVLGVVCDWQVGCRPWILASALP